MQKEVYTVRKLASGTEMIVFEDSYLSAYGMIKSAKEYEAQKGNPNIAVLDEFVTEEGDKYVHWTDEETGDKFLTLLNG